MAGKTRTRADLAKALYRNVGLSLTESNQLVGEVFEIMTQALEKGETVKVSSFASFRPRHKKARVGRNPKSGQTYPISARNAISFDMSNGLKKKVKGCVQ
ncbi:MAG: integration host factor subunit alpha [Alphaproteobacteria bacterium]|nr:integration host factor subunit alpha [Alphaproteobacteria bacterium]